MHLLFFVTLGVHATNALIILQRGVLTTPALLALDDNGLPMGLRKFTALAPLGPATATIGSEKQKCSGESHLSNLSAALAHDLVEGATGQGSYLITGDLRPEIFRDNCRFVDPTNDVTSLSRFQKAAIILFEPSLSS